jgi:hypothetical protein
MDVGVAIRHSKYRCTNTGTHGDHGVKPPLREIENETQLWLESLHLNTKGEYVDYCLSVEARRMLINNDFYGVRAFRIPSFNQSCIEIRVRPRGNSYDYQWQCFLTFPKEKDLVRNILRITRPEAESCLIRYKKEDQKLLSDNAATEDVKVRKERQTQKKLIDKYIAILEHNGATKSVCYHARLIQNDSKLIPNINLHRVVSDYLDYEIPMESWFYFTSALIDQGVIEPTLDDNDDVFRPTPLFDEYVAEVRQGKQSKERQQLDRRIGKITESQNGLTSARKKLMKQLNENRSQLRAGDRELKTCKDKLGNLDFVL